MSSFPTKTASRRTLMKGLAWTTPVIVASKAVPAYAASSTPKIVKADYSFFVQVDNTSPETPFSSDLGVGTVFTGGASAEDGVFPPAQSANGAGLWIGSPTDENGKPLAGVTTVAQGAQFTMTYSFAFESEDDIYDPYGPADDSAASEWLGAQGPYVYEAVNGNQAKFQVDLAAPTHNGSSWVGVATFTLLEDLKVESTGSTVNYAVLLLSQAAVYYDMSDGISSATASVAGTQGLVNATSAEGSHVYPVSAIPGVSATLNLS